MNQNDPHVDQEKDPHVDHSNPHVDQNDPHMDRNDPHVDRRDPNEIFFLQCMPTCFVCSLFSTKRLNRLNSLICEWF